jgi:hypothetical protein
MLAKEKIQIPRYPEHAGCPTFNFVIASDQRERGNLVSFQCTGKIALSLTLLAMTLSDSQLAAGSSFLP